jgi:hypothetical protein
VNSRQSSIGRLLIQLKNSRQACLDAETLEHYSSSLSGFSDAAIERACAELERKTLSEFEPRFPPLAELLSACRKATGDLVRPPETEWTMERYRLMVWFDKWLTEQIEEGATREVLLAAHPEVAPAWVRWKNQRLNGTIQIPAGWCDKCEGHGVRVRNDLNGPRSVLRCECRRQAA